MNDSGSVNTNSTAYKNGFITGVVATAGLERIAAGGAESSTAAAETKTSTVAQAATHTDFVVDSSGKAFPVPTGANGPVPVN